MESWWHEMLVDLFIAALTYHSRCGRTRMTWRSPKWLVMTFQTSFTSDLKKKSKSTTSETPTKSTSSSSKEPPQTSTPLNKSAWFTLATKSTWCHTKPGSVCKNTMSWESFRRRDKRGLKSRRWRMNCEWNIKSVNGICFFPIYDICIIL